MLKNVKVDLTAILLIIQSFAYSAAIDEVEGNQLFQNFDNQISIGYNFNSLNTYNPKFGAVRQTSNTSAVNIHLEQLFDSNVWLGVDGNFIFNASQSGNNAFGLLNSIQAFGLPSSLTGKAGYSFNWSSIGLQVIPYLTTGVVLNYNGASFPYSGFSNSYYISYGGGAKIEYVITRDFSLFFDQMIGYLNDRSTSPVNQSAINYASTLGVKYNMTDAFQIGLQGSVAQLNTTGNIGNDAANLVYRNSNQTSYGGTISFAYLYGEKHGRNVDQNDNYFDAYLAHFDNSYSLGYGFLRSTNSYSGGNLPTINSDLNTLNVEFSHLFQNNLWAKINGSLITALDQANVPGGSTVQNLTPVYSGFPGDVTFNLGYAITFPTTHMHIIPYLNGGIDANINSYNISSSTSLSQILSRDLYLQYGAGARFEYSPTHNWFIYLDQLFAGLNDRSSNNIDSWRSTTTLGTKLNITSNVMVGVDGFYDVITPTAATYNPGAGINYALQQNTIGGIINFGVNY